MKNLKKMLEKDKGFSRLSWTNTKVSYVFYNNLHHIFLMIRSMIMVTLIFNMYIENVSPKKC